MIPTDGDAAFVTLHASTAAMASMMCSGAARGGRVSQSRRLTAMRARGRCMTRDEDDEHVCAREFSVRAHADGRDDDASDMLCGIARQSCDKTDTFHVSARFIYELLHSDCLKNECI